MPSCVSAQQIQEYLAAVEGSSTRACFATTSHHCYIPVTLDSKLTGIYAGESHAGHQILLHERCLSAKPSLASPSMSQVWSCTVYIL